MPERPPPDDGPDGEATLLTRERMEAWPLPEPDEEGDKEDRGRVLIVGGSKQVPGGVVLAAVAALRAGAGKVQIAAGESIALTLAGAVPEARVFGLPETAGGEVTPDGLGSIDRYLGMARSILIGPGMVDEEAAAALMAKLLPLIEDSTVTLDAAPLAYFAHDRECCHRFGGRAILTPHAGEMAGMLRNRKSELLENREETVRRAAREFQAVVALKGAETVIAAPDGTLYRNRTGNVGLATSGSGDTLAGIVAGLVARGCDPIQAAAWGVYLHGSAGDRLAERVGPIGFLARELLDEIPRLMAEFTSCRQR